MNSRYKHIIIMMLDSPFRDKLITNIVNYFDLKLEEKINNDIFGLDYIYSNSDMNVSSFLAKRNPSRIPNISDMFIFIFSNFPLKDNNLNLLNPILDKEYLIDPMYLLSIKDPDDIVPSLEKIIKRPANLIESNNFFKEGLDILPLEIKSKIIESCNNISI